MSPTGKGYEDTIIRHLNLYGECVVSSADSADFIIDCSVSTDRKDYYKSCVRVSQKGYENFYCKEICKEAVLISGQDNLIPTAFDLIAKIDLEYILEHLPIIEYPANQPVNKTAQ